MVENLLGLMSLISFTTSLRAASSNEKLFWLSTYLLLRMMFVDDIYTFLWLYQLDHQYFESFGL